MKKFCLLISQLERQSDQAVLGKLLLTYLNQADPDDKLWAIALLSHKRPSRCVTIQKLKEWAIASADIPAWLFEASSDIVKDKVETITKILPIPDTSPILKLSDALALIGQLRGADLNFQQLKISDTWAELGIEERLLFNKLLTGTFRTSLPAGVINEALARHLDIDVLKAAAILTQDWSPQKISFQSLSLSRENEPPLFEVIEFGAMTAIHDFTALSDIESYLVEYAWEGRRAQLVKSGSAVYIWTDEGELVQNLLPELEVLATLEFDFVLEGWLSVIIDGKVLGAESIMKRLSARKATKMLISAAPVTFIAYDVWQIDDRRLRLSPYKTRKEVLIQRFAEGLPNNLSVSSFLDFDSLEDLKRLRSSCSDISAQGLMFSLQSTINKGTQIARHLWPRPLNNAIVVLLYANFGGRGGLSSKDELTFAARSGDNWIPVVKCALELPEAEQKLIKAFVKQHTIEKFGPVRSVKPELVFEICFTAIAKTTRKKCGFTLKSPKIIRQLPSNALKKTTHITEFLSLL